jgi:hypothetical protein
MSFVSLCNPFFHFADQLVKGRIEALGYFPQPDGRGIHDSPFQPAHISPVETAFGTQLFVGDPGLTTNLGHNNTDGFLSKAGGLDLASAPLHRQTQS